MAITDLEKQAVQGTQVFDNSVTAQNPYAMARQRGYPIKPGTDVATVNYFQSAQPIEQVFNPKQYLSEMIGSEATLQQDGKKLRRLGMALQMMNPNFNANAHISAWEDSARNALKTRWDALKTVNQQTVDTEIEKRYAQLKPTTEKEWQQIWDTFGIYDSTARKKHFDLWRDLNPKVDTSLLTSNIFTRASRQAYQKSKNVQDLVIDEKLELRGYKDKSALQNVQKQYRDEFVKGSKDFIGIVDAFGRLLTSAREDSGAGDLSLIFNYMKMLDPNSVVREGEFANAENAPGIEARILNIYNKVRDGNRLRPQDRIMFLEAAECLFAQKEASQQRFIEQYSTLAKKADVDASMVILQYAPRVTLDIDKDGTQEEYIKIGTYLVPARDLEYGQDDVADFEKWKKEAEDKERRNTDASNVYLPEPVN